MLYVACRHAAFYRDFLMTKIAQEEFSPYRENLSVQVADHLERTILDSSDVTESDKLPSEQKLAATYKVSRPVVREALKLLQERGLVTLKNGLGAFVTKPKSSTVMSAVNRIIQMNNISEDELTQMRAMLEVNAAELAAKKITDEHLKKIEDNIERFSDRTLTLPERVELDSEFHNLVAMASGNALLAMFNDVLISMLTNYMGKGVLVTGGIDDAIARHKKIFDALKNHDVKAVRVAMNEHIAASRQNVEQYNSNPTF